MNTILSPSSISNEYYFGDLPGTIQYKKEPEELINLQIPDNSNDRGFALLEHSMENLRRVMPHTQKIENWKILLMMSAEIDCEIWLKTALLNKTTGKVALLTSTNNKENLLRREHRAIKTHDGTWFVGHYRMCAPAIFWSELKNRLLY
jgi:hypothetical protein